MLWFFILIFGELLKKVKRTMFAHNSAYSGFETQKRCHQKSKTGVLVAQQKAFKKEQFVHDFWLSKNGHHMSELYRSNVWCPDISSKRFVVSK